MIQAAKATLILLSSTSALILTAGCSDGIGSSGDIAAIEQSLNDNLDMSKLDSELDQMESSLDNYKTQLDALSVTSLASQGDGGKKLAEKFKEIVSKLTEAIDRAKLEAEVLKVKLESRLNQLDPNNPQHQTFIERINEALAYLDQVKDVIEEAKIKLIEKIDSILAKVDSLVNQIDSSNPLRIVVGIIWGSVKTEIIAARTELAA